MGIKAKETIAVGDDGGKGTQPGEVPVLLSVTWSKVPILTSSAIYPNQIWIGFFEIL